MSLMLRIVLRHARQREKTGIEKVNRAMLKALLDFARRHFVLFWGSEICRRADHWFLS